MFTDGHLWSQHQSLPLLPGLPVIPRGWLLERSNLPISKKRPC